MSNKADVTFVHCTNTDRQALYIGGVLVCSGKPLTMLDVAHQLDDIAGFAYSPQTVEVALESDDVWPHFETQLYVRATKLKSSTYTGFNQDFSTPHVLALVSLGGETVESFALDFDNLQSSVSSLSLYLEDAYEHCTATLIGLYREDGFRGITLSTTRVSDISRFKGDL